MNKKALLKVNKVAIAEKAWELAYVRDVGFTAISLAGVLNMPANRHFRQYLNSLATKGLLYAYRQLDDDGYYRKYFYRQATRPMFVPGTEVAA